MPPKIEITIDKADKEIFHFLEKARSSRELRVKFDGEIYVVKMALEKLSTHGREFLMKGGPTDD